MLEYSYYSNNSNNSEYSNNNSVRKRDNGRVV